MKFTMLIDFFFWTILQFELRASHLDRHLTLVSDSKTLHHQEGSERGLQLRSPAAFIPMSVSLGSSFEARR
jgi:hypothetical protein